MSDIPVAEPTPAAAAASVTAQVTPAAVAIAETVSGEQVPVAVAGTPVVDTKPVEATPSTTEAATAIAAAAATATTETTPAAAAAAADAAKPEETKTEETKTEEKKEAPKKEAPKKVVTPMFGVAQSAYGKPRDVLSLSKELVKPEIRSSKQILIRVHAAGINPVDYKFLHGNIAAMVKRKFPYTPGLDVAGVVEAVGKGVKRFKVGDAVYADLGVAGGAYADYVVADEYSTALKPTNLTFAEAATVPVAALTSYQALLKHGGLKTGQKVLVLGGAGGTGSYGIQIAKHFGAHVTATASARNQAFCQAMGAERVFDYSSGEWWNTLPKHSFHIIYDTVGEKKAWEHAKQVLAKGGIFVTIAGDNPSGKTTVGGFLGEVMTVAGRKFASLVTRHRYHWFLTDASGADLTTLAKLFEEQKIRPVIEKYFTIENQETADSKEGVIELFEHMESGHTRGKLALEIHDAGERHVFDFDSLPAYVPPVEPEVKEEVKTEVKAEPATVTSTPAETSIATATTTEKPAEKPAEAAATPDDKPADKPTDKPAEAAAAPSETTPAAVPAQ